MKNKKKYKKAINFFLLHFFSCAFLRETTMLTLSAQTAKRKQKDDRGEREKEEKSSYPIGVIAKQMSDVSVTSSSLLPLVICKL